MYPSSGHPRCRWVCFFIRTDLEKFNITLKCYLVWIRREICTDQTPFKRKNRPKQICGWIFDVRGQQGMYFFTRGSIIMDYGLVSDALKLKPHDDGFVSYKHAAFGFTRCYLMDWSGVDYLWLLWCFYQLFGLSFWRHPFTAEDPLVSKLWNAIFLQICSDEETNASAIWMAWGWVHFQWFLFLTIF